MNIASKGIFCTILMLFWALSYTHAQARTSAAYAPQAMAQDEELHEGQICALTYLGMLWGFVKYHHIQVKKGKYNIDKELFDIVPRILSTKDTLAHKGMMQEWVAHFGQVYTADTLKPGNDSVKLTPNYGYIFDTGVFSNETIALLHNILSTSTSYSTQRYVRKENSVMFINERSYTDSFPNTSVRLLALFRYWNAIQYFYPYRHLIDSNWNTSLTRFIPLFYHATDTASYVDACRELTSAISDGHAGTWGGISGSYSSKFKTFPIKTKFIDNKLYIVDIADTLDLVEKLRIGDIIKEVDGSTIEEHIQKHRSKCPVANYTCLMAFLSAMGNDIFCTRDPYIHLKVVRDGKELAFTYPRMPFPPQLFRKRMFESDTPYRILNNDIGYIYPAKLADVNLDTMMKELNSTKGLIIDLRCYPKKFMPFTFGKWLKCQETPFVTFYEPDINTPGRFTINKPMYNGSNDTSCYKGKLIIIANYTTRSQAEYTVMALSTVPGAKVIGDTTAGSDGDVSIIELPGGIHTMISGRGIMYPDGRETQRIGIRIDKYIRPTIAGIIARKDELLAEAIKMIEQ